MGPLKSCSSGAVSSISAKIKSVKRPCWRSPAFRLIRGSNAMLKDSLRSLGHSGPSKMGTTTYGTAPMTKSAARSVMPTAPRSWPLYVPWPASWQKTQPTDPKRPTKPQLQPCTGFVTPTVARPFNGSVHPARPFDRPLQDQALNP